MSKSRPTPSEFASSPYDPNLEREFFCRILLTNGSWKTTDRCRLDDLNRSVLPFIEQMPERPLEILDVAASSGIGTQEWSDQLSASGIEARVIGTDLCVEARHLRWKFFEALLDKDWRVIHLSVFGRGVHGRGGILHMPFILGLKAAVRFSLAQGAGTRPFRLVSKAVRTVRLVEEDIEGNCSRLGGLFHVIRAANVLNVNYFPAPRLKRMATALVRRLRPGGLLIICRTHKDRINHATVFRLQDSRLAVIARLGNGSELEDVVLQVVLQDAGR